MHSILLTSILSALLLRPACLSSLRLACPCLHLHYIVYCLSLCDMWACGGQSTMHHISYSMHGLLCHATCYVLPGV